MSLNIQIPSRLSRIDGGKKTPHVKGLEGKSLFQKISGSFGWKLWLVVFYMQEIEITCFWLLKLFGVCSKWYVGKTQWFMMALQFCPLWNKGDFARKCCVVLSKPFCQPNKKASYTRTDRSNATISCGRWGSFHECHWSSATLTGRNALARGLLYLDTMHGCLDSKPLQPFCGPNHGESWMMSIPFGCPRGTVLTTCTWPSLSMALPFQVWATVLCGRYFSCSEPSGPLVWALLHRDCAGLTACYFFLISDILKTPKRCQHPLTVWFSNEKKHLYPQGARTIHPLWRTYHPYVSLEEESKKSFPTDLATCDLETPH